MEFMGKLYTVDDIAKMTGLTSRTIRNYLKDGSLEGKKIGGQWRFTMENIEKLFNSNEVKRDMVDTRKQEVIDFIDGVNTDINGEIQICTIVDYYCDDNITAKSISDKLISVINDEKSPESQTAKYSYVFDEKESKARFTLFGTPQFIIKTLQIVEDLWNYHYSSKNNFTDKVKNYSKYRPSYSAELVNYLYTEVGFNNNSVIADIGSGTGIFSKQLLERGSIVKCIEPNLKMRLDAEKSLSEYPGFYSIDASAEETTLDDKSVDFISCASAFHWFDKEKCKTEFKRILKPEGKVVLVWNGPSMSNIFQADMGAIYNKYCKNTASKETKLSKDELVSGFFKDEAYDKRVFNYTICEDFETLKGGMLSASYAPKPTDENYAEYIDDIKKMFDKYSVNNKISTVFEQVVYCGKL